MAHAPSSPIPMPRLARTPQELHTLFVENFNAGNLDGLMALYEPGAVIVSEPGGPSTHSRQALRAGLEGYLALKAQITLETIMAVQADDLALLRSEWRLTGTGPDGKPVDMTHQSAEIGRRGPDGVWRYVIDHPFGAD